MKKPTAQKVTLAQTPARSLFGVSNDKLKAVFGGGGVIINAPKDGGVIINRG